MTVRDIFLIICSVGAIQSIFLGVNFLFFYEKKNISSKLLGGLFLVVGIRVLKSTIYLFTDNVDLLLINVGFAAHYFIGPFLLLYIQSLKQNYNWSKWQWLHFIPGSLVLLTSWWLPLEDFWYSGGYSALLFHSIIYLALAVAYLLINRKTITNIQFKWGAILTLGLFIFLFTYFSNYELRLNPYHYAPLVYAAVVYTLSFYLIKKRGAIFSKEAKYRNINIDEEQAENFKSRILEHYESNHPYLNSDYTLSMLSEELKIPKHLLSHIFSSKIKLSFVDFTNRYKIEKAKSILETNPNFTVSSVAFDSGFNSLSSFNQAFKRFTNKTPSQYRSEHSD